MTPIEFSQQVKEAEARLAAGRPLERREQILLLASLLIGQTTRQEKRYGQP